MQCSDSLEEGPCRESVATPFTLLMGSFSVSMVQRGALAITLRFQDVYDGVLPVGSC